MERCLHPKSLWKTLSNLVIKLDTDSLDCCEVWRKSKAAQVWLPGSNFSLKALTAFWYEDFYSAFIPSFQVTSKLPSSGVHSFQVAAHFSVSNQSSNVIVVSSSVNESIGGAFPQ